MHCGLEEETCWKVHDTEILADFSLINNYLPAMASFELVYFSLISNHITGIPILCVVCRKACSQFEAGVVRTPPYVPCAFLSACLPACLQPLCSYASDLVQRGRGGSREGGGLLPLLNACVPSAFTNGRPHRVEQNKGS